jgi:ribonuclease HI
LLALLDLHDVRFEWVRGHAGNRENERADALVRKAVKGQDLAIDENYEHVPPESPPTRLF